MTKKKNGIRKQRMHVASPKPVTALRQMAEEKAARVPEDLAAVPPAQFPQIIHELRVHQIELEMQNEELRTAQADLDAMQARHFDLYDQAPVGYVTVSENGQILEANLTAASLLETARSTLVKKPLSRFILQEDQEIYFLHHTRLLATEAPQMFELRMLKKTGQLCWVRLDATIAHDMHGVLVCRVTLSDITARKQTEEQLRQQADELRARVEELTRFNHVTTGRELRMIELKQEVNELATQLGRPHPYPLAFMDAAAAAIVQTTPKES